MNKTIISNNLFCCCYMYVKLHFKPLIQNYLYSYELNNVDFYRITNLELAISSFIDCKHLYSIGI